MDKSKLNEILQMSDAIVSMQDLVLMERLTMKYPYCNIFWALGAKYAVIIDSFNKKDWLQKAAVYISDREYLKGFVTNIKKEKSSLLDTDKPQSHMQKEIMRKIDAYQEDDLSQNPTREEIIDRFLKIEKPQVDTKNHNEQFEGESIDKSVRNSASKDFKIVTETMAQIHLKQGNKEAAIKIYQRLMADNPKKSIYFANRIEEIKNS